MNLVGLYKLEQALEKTMRAFEAFTKVKGETVESVVRVLRAQIETWQALRTKSLEWAAEEGILKQRYLGLTDGYEAAIRDLERVIKELEK